MIHAAHASQLHWKPVGTIVNQQRGAWMLARVYSELALPERALYYARQCHELTRKHADEMEAFDNAYAAEAMARAHAIAGDLDQAGEHYRRARELGELLATEDKTYFDGDLSAGNWGSFEAWEK